MRIAVSPPLYSSRILLPIVLLLARSAAAQDTKYPPDGEQIPGPPSKEATADWLSEITRYRAERRVRAGLFGALYARPEFRWTQSSFIQPQSMVEDRYLYDPATRRYTVDRFLDDLDHRYGGIDSVLLWPVYPNIGIDNRNQFDLLRDMPGGLPALKQMIDELHRRHVRVLFPNMPWDQGTRAEPRNFPDTLATLMAEIGADGVNGDTYNGIPRSFRIASDATNHPIALEPENPLESDEMIEYNGLSWGYWKYPFVPSISRYKWLEPRHMVNVCDRWAKDKTNNLQFAFFNGVGYESWENIWGIWNGITPRDAEAIRRVSKIERRYAEYLVSPNWEPHTPTLQYGVFASKWPRAGSNLWTIVNRTVYNIKGPQLAVPSQPGMRYFDLWNGKELKPENGALAFPIEALGFAAILAQPEPPTAADTAFLAEMAQLSAKPLSSFAKAWQHILQLPVRIAPTAPATQPPPGMVPIPANPAYLFEVHGIEIEGGDDIGVDVQYFWEDSPRRHHSFPVEIPAFYIDRYNVTNREFAAFLAATNYHPADDHNFLRDWSNGKYPAGWDNKPVTWVSLEDARAYAAWAGKRLPHEWEWQYAAQGIDHRLYPWGNTPCDTCVPKPEHGRDLHGPADTGAFPKGASPYAVMDLTGNIWQWTDEYQDEHTRAAILRGGAYYRPDGSRWYFPSAYKLNEHGKYLLMAPSKDRAATLGFRCVKDAR